MRPPPPPFGRPDLHTRLRYAIETGGEVAWPWHIYTRENMLGRLEWHEVNDLTGEHIAHAFLTTATGRGVLRKNREFLAANPNAISDYLEKQNEPTRPD